MGVMPLFARTWYRAETSAIGFICRHDVAQACKLALTARLEGFQPFHPMATQEGRRTFVVDRTERMLGWRPESTFDDLPEPSEDRV